MRTYRCLTVLVLACALAPAAVAGPVAQIELLALDGGLGSHEITVTPGTTVQLAYLLTDPDKLAFPMDLLTVIGPASPLSLVSGASWWQQQPGTSLALVDQPGGQFFLGESRLASSPFSHSATGMQSIAVFELTCEGPGDVVIQAFNNVALARSEDFVTQPLEPYDTSQLAFSAGRVTIHQGPAEPIIRVADGQEDVGKVVIEHISAEFVGALALATDPGYVFSHWEETTGSGVPGGDPSAPRLVVPSTAPIELIANFAVIPEPMSLGLLGLGIVALVRRRRA